MKKVVEKPIKIDLHIHSSISAHKDGKKVEFNSIENIPVLVSKLKENGVDMCAITDHDRFSFQMYKELKAYEGNGLLKILPGVEFSVNFDGKNIIHIVTIFDDRDEEKLQYLDQLFVDGIGKEKYHNGSYSKDDYHAILKEVDVDFVMIYNGTVKLDHRCDNLS